MKTITLYLCLVFLCVNYTMQAQEKDSIQLKKEQDKRYLQSRLEIIKATKLTNSGKLTDILYELETSGFITIYGGYGKKVKESLYRLTDAYSLFYLTFLEPLGKNNQLDFTKLSDLPLWKTWSGYTFENICLIHINEIRKALSITGMTSSVSSFVARPKDGLSGTQIDLLISDLILKFRSLIKT